MRSRPTSFRSLLALRLLDSPLYHLHDIIVVLSFQPGPHTQPERAIHDDVCIGETTFRHPVLNTFISRLLGEIARKEQSRTNLILFQEAHKFISVQRTALAHGEQETKPAWVAFRRRFRKDEVFLKLLH